MVEFFVRHGDHLIDTTVVTDPVFLTEAEVRSDDFFPATLGSMAPGCTRATTASRLSVARRTMCRIICLASSPS